jgi:hypothetical protein
VFDWINIALAVTNVCIKRFFKHLHIKVAKLRINVATGDAASTAILYGVIIQSVAYTFELMNSYLKLKDLKKADIAVNADYLSEKTTFEMKIIFSLRVWNLFSIMFGALGKTIIKLIETMPQDSSFSSETNTSVPQKKEDISKNGK